MVRFGKTLEEQRVPEWASGYVDYKGLKKTLASMIASGSIQDRANIVFHFSLRRRRSRKCQLFWFYCSIDRTHEHVV